MLVLDWGVEVMARRDAEFPRPWRVRRAGFGHSVNRQLCREQVELGVSRTFPADCTHGNLQVAE